MFWKRLRLLILAAVVSVACALAGGAAVAASAAPHSPSHRALHSPGGIGPKTMYRDKGRVHVVRLGKPQVAQAAGRRVMATRFAVHSSARSVSASCAYPQLCYQGGAIQAHPHMYFVFWGPWWYCAGSGCVNCPTNPNGCGNADSRTVESYLYYYWHQVGAYTESWSTINSQYYDHTHAHPVFGNGIWGNWVAWQQDPPMSPTAADLSNMATTAATYYGAQNDPSAQIVVLTPQSIQPYLSDDSSQFPGGGWCAYHNSALLTTGTQLSYTVMPWLPDAPGNGCWSAPGSSGSLTPGFSKVGGHEFAESVTDPVPGTGYYTAQPGVAGNTEIGDRCNNNTFTETMPDGSQYLQQELWSNVEKGCVQSMPVGKITGDHGKCIDNAGNHAANGNKIDIYRCNGTAAQLIWYTPSSGHLIVDGGCLDVSGASRSPGAKIIWYHCGTGSNQKWEYDSNSHQWQVYRGIGGFGAMCLDDPNSSSVNGTQLQIYNCNSTAAQQWFGPA